MSNSVNLGRVSGLASLLLAAVPMLAIAVVAFSTGFVAA